MIDALNNFADVWFGWQMAMLWQVAVLIGIVWLIDRMIRKWAWPQVRYALWLLVLLKLLLPPTLTSPVSFTSQIPAIADKTVKVQIYQPAENTIEPITPAETATALTTAADHTEAQPATPANIDIAAAPIETAHVPATSVVVSPSLSWKVYGLFVWLGGAVVLAAWLIIRLNNLRNEHLRSDLRMKVPERFHEILRVTATRLRLRRLPEVILTDKVRCPAVFGLFRPVLLMPADKLKNLTRQDTEHILLHELAHIKRGDLFVHAIHMCLQIVYWFNPLLWLVRRQLQNLRELCCDATVAKLLKDNTYSYRETLLKTARQLLAEPVDPGLGLMGLFENSNWLVERLKWLEKKTWKNRPLRIVTVFVLVGVMLSCVLPMARAEKNMSDILPISPEKLIGKIAENEQKIQDIQLHMVCKVVKDDWLFYEYDWGYDHGKEFYSGDRYRKDRLGQTSSQERTKAYDGNKYYSYYEDPDGDKVRLSGIIEASDDSYGVSLTFNSLLGYSSYGYDRVSLSQIMARADNVTVKDKPELIDGHSCYVVDVINSNIGDSPGRICNTRLWIDYKRDFRVLKRELYFDKSDEKQYFKGLRKSMDNIKLAKIDGIWLPIQGERSYYRTEDRLPDGMSMAQFALLSESEQRDLIVFETIPSSTLKTRRLTIDPASIQLNKGISNERFTIEFPEGCEVYDSRTGKRYVVGEASEKESTYDDWHWVDWAGELSVDELIDVLKDTKQLNGVELKKAFAVLNRLVQIKSDAVSKLGKELVETDKAKVQSFIALTLRAIGDPVSVPSLIDALERSFHSSDYGFGSLRGEKSMLEKVYQQYQLNPSKAGLGLGRPVREITVALEKLTGHTEGHEHYYAHDSQGNRFGSHTITPEIVDRRRKNLKQVADRWRQWWQDNKEAVLSGQLPVEKPKEVIAPKPKTSETPRQTGIIAAPEGAELSFSIVPNIGSKQPPSLTQEEYQRYVDDLKANGPFRGSMRGDSFQWSRVKEDIAGVKQLPVSIYKDKKYILLCAREQYVLRPEFEGKRVWGLKSARADKDAIGNPIVIVDFDETGGNLFHELTKANVGNRIAIEAAWSGFGICSAPEIMMAIKRSAVITGNFTQQQAEGLAKLLKSGMPPVGLGADEANKKTDVQIKQAEEKTQSSNFTATLDNGVTVELVGVCENPSEGKQWWRPNGNLLKERPYKKHAGKARTKNKKTYESAFKLVGAGSDDASIAIAGHGGLFYGFGKGIYCKTLAADPEDKAIDLEVGIACQPWTTRHEQGVAEGVGVSSMGKVTFGRPIEKKEKTVMTVSHSIDTDVYQVRLIAVDNAGKEIMTSGSEGAGSDVYRQITMTFNLPIADIKMFRLQTRKYEWITFKNISLRPGVKTDLQIEIGSEKNSDVVGVQDSTSAEAAYIIQKVLDRYAAINTYSAVGEEVVDVKGPRKTLTGLLTKVLTRNKPRQIRSVFAIKMARPNLYCIEWDNNVDTNLRKIGNAWSIGDGSHALFLGKEQSFEDPLRALISAQNIGQVQSTLFFDTSLNILRTLRELSQEKDETVEGVDCYVISGKRLSQSFTYWVSKKDFLIRKYRFLSGGDGKNGEKGFQRDFSDKTIKRNLESAGKDSSPEAVAKKKASDIALHEKVRKIEATHTQTYRNIILDRPIPKDQFQPTKNIKEARKKLRDLEAKYIDPFKNISPTESIMKPDVQVKDGSVSVNNDVKITINPHPSGTPYFVKFDKDYLLELVSRCYGEDITGSAGNFNSGNRSRPQSVQKHIGFVFNFAPLEEEHMRITKRSQFRKELLKTIRQDIEQALGVRVQSGGNSKFLRFNYTKDTVEGSLNIFFTLEDSRFLSLQFSIQEVITSEAKSEVDAITGAT